jgi:hypothetical protein
MSRLIYNSGGYSLSHLRDKLQCGLGGYTTASSIRAGFAGYAGTGNMAFAKDSWIDDRCWTLAVDSGSGNVAVTSPWYSGYSTVIEPQSYAVTSNNNVWVSINASANTNYTFQYWLRTDPFEVWSYAAATDYYVPTGGWQDTFYIGAVFSYTPPPPPPTGCYYYSMEGNYYGVPCNGYGTYGYSWDQLCMQSVDYGGWNTYNGCSDPNCLVKGTSIEMADGTHKLIEKIRLGDVLKGMKINDAPEDDTIIGWSTDDLNLVETSVVVVGILPFASKGIHNFNNGLIETSESHAHFIKRGNDWSFKQARNIQVGDFLVDKNGNSIEITSIDVLQGDEKKIVYSMDVENTDTYIANGLITHNPPTKLEFE